MIKILHISDVHAQFETMARVNTLAISKKDVDVLAYTGDSCSDSVSQLPDEWSTWPQRIKLAVPGCHDNTDTLSNLKNWIVKTPWQVKVADLVFIGIDTRRNWNELESELKKIPIKNTRGLVLLFHRWPLLQHAIDVGRMLALFKDRFPICILHGHNHDKEDPEWKENAELGSVRCYRSKIITSARRMRGVGGLVTWNHNTFSWKQVLSDC